MLSLVESLHTNIFTAVFTTINSVSTLSLKFAVGRVKITHVCCLFYKKLIASMVECVLTWIRAQYLVVCNIAKWTILCIVVQFQPVIKLLQRGVKSASQTCDFDAKNAKIFWGGTKPTPQTPPPVGRGTPPPPQRLDLKPSHSEILPTLVEVII